MFSSNPTMNIILWCWLISGAFVSTLSAVAGVMLWCWWMLEIIWRYTGFYEKLWEVMRRMYREKVEQREKGAG